MDPLTTGTLIASHPSSFNPDQQILSIFNTLSTIISHFGWTGLALFIWWYAALPLPKFLLGIARLSPNFTGNQQSSTQLQPTPIESPPIAQPSIPTSSLFPVSHADFTPGAVQPVSYVTEGQLTTAVNGLEHMMRSKIETLGKEIKREIKEGFETVFEKMGEHEKEDDRRFNEMMEKVEDEDRRLWQEVGPLGKKVSYLEGASGKKA